MDKEAITKAIIEFIQNPDNVIIDDQEQVSEDCYYSKAIRAVCVLDSAFDAGLDDILSAFNADNLYENHVSVLYYQTEYGMIRISRDERLNTMITFADEDDE